MSSPHLPLLSLCVMGLLGRWGRWGGESQMMWRVGQRVLETVRAPRGWRWAGMRSIATTPPATAPPNVPLAGLRAWEHKRTLSLTSRPRGQGPLLCAYASTPAASVHKAEPEEVSVEDNNYMHIYAFSIGGYIDLAAVQRVDFPHHDHSFSNNSKLLLVSLPSREGSGGPRPTFVTFFSFGSIVVFNVPAPECQEYVEVARRHMSVSMKEELREDRLCMDDYQLLVVPDQQEPVVLHEDRCSIQSMNDMHAIRIVSAVLGQSVAMNVFEEWVNEKLLRDFTPRGVNHAHTLSVTDAIRVKFVMQLGLLDRQGRCCVVTSTSR
eukprot:TRINITY_DN891_c0_g1_i2.p1 TRINITY_DN891_c0_g1~~TRINITY_DN891_c0_g1_i2.p1  ORF type:complete len:352 (+),score=55.46 TRINITY_DN891_c0_g1_i2:93-1058(+)